MSENIEMNENLDALVTRGITRLISKAGQGLSAEQVSETQVITLVLAALGAASLIESPTLKDKAIKAALKLGNKV